MRNSSALPPRSRILIVRLSSIGDVLHTTTVVHNLRRLAPDAEITWLASPPASTLLETNPDIDRLLVFDRRPIDEAGAHLRLRTCWRELKKARALLAPYTFDIALDLQGLFLTGLLTRLSKAPRRIGIHERHEGNPLFMTEMAPDIPDPHKIRRYYTALCDLRKGNGAQSIVDKLELLMEKANVSTNDRPVISAAKQKAALTGDPAAAIELPDGTIITGKTSSLLGAVSAMLLNALKVLGGIDDSVNLMSPEIIEPIQHLKTAHLGNHNPRLHLDEMLIALTICATHDPNAETAMQQLEKLRGCEAHSSVILSEVDENTFKKLGVNVTCEPQYQTKKLFHK